MGEVVAIREEREGRGGERRGPALFFPCSLFDFFFFFRFWIAPRNHIALKKKTEHRFRFSPSFSLDYALLAPLLAANTRCWCLYEPAQKLRGEGAFAAERLPLFVVRLPPIITFSDLVDRRCRRHRRRRCLSRPCLLALFSPSRRSVGKDANRAKLAAAGLLAAGFASMALANTLWYSAAFLISWKAVLAANSPAAVARASVWALAAKAFAISYAVSQASKVPRGAAILLLAPAADRVLNSVSKKTKLSKWQLAGGFGVACLGLLLSVVATTVGATAALNAVAATAALKAVAATAALKAVAATAGK